MKLRSGDAILVTCEGRTVPGEIILISENQVSAMIRFEAVFGGHAGEMPCMRWDAGRNAYRSIINGTEITLKKAAS